MTAMFYFVETSLVRVCACWTNRYSIDCSILPNVGITLYLRCYRGLALLRVTYCGIMAAGLLTFKLMRLVSLTHSTVGITN